MHTSLSRIGSMSIFAAITGMVLAIASAANAQQTASECQVKAAYLYNFGKATEWPAQAMPSEGSSLVLCVFGGNEESVNVLRSTLAGKTIRGHPLEIRHRPLRQS